MLNRALFNRNLGSAMCDKEFLCVTFLGLDLEFFDTDTSTNIRHNTHTSMLLIT